MPDTKTLAVFLPFVGACLYGLVYTLDEKIFEDVNPTTYIFIYCIASILVMLLLHFISPFKLNFLPLKGRAVMQLVGMACLTGLCAWLVTLFSIKNTSASYTAIAEISYPLFTILFGYLIYSRKIDWSMALGAGLIITGSYILVTGKLKVEG